MYSKMKLAGKLINPKIHRSSYQRNIDCELDTKNNVFPTINMLLLHQATDVMHANIPVATSKIQYPIENPITLQQESNMNVRFNSYTDQERNYNVQGYIFLGARSTINENQSVLSSLSSCEAHVSCCYSCDRSLKIIMAEGSKRILNLPFDLVLITKMTLDYHTDSEF